MKKRCRKGKSCGATCIERNDICRLDLGSPLSKSMGEVRGNIQSPPSPGKSEPLPREVVSHLKVIEEGFKAIRNLEKQNLPDGEWDWRSKEVEDRIKQSRDKVFKSIEKLPESERARVAQKVKDEERRIKRSVYTEEELVGKINPLIQKIREKRKKKEDFSDLFDKARDLVETLTGDKQREMTIKLNLSRGKRLKVNISHSSESQEDSTKAGKNFLSKYGRLEEVAAIAKRYDAVLQSVEKRLKEDGLSEKERSKLEDKIKSVRYKRDRAENKLVIIMEKVRAEMLKTSLTDGQVNDLVHRVMMPTSPKIKNDAIEFIKMFNGRGFTDFLEDSTNDVKSVRFIRETSDRAMAETSKGGVSTNHHKRTTFHELAHIVEAQRPWMSQYAVTWRNSKGLDIYDSRTETGIKYLAATGFQTTPTGSSIPMVKLNSLHPNSNYKDYEVAVVDKFLSTYMGKVYLPSGGSRQAITEVWSMAFEHFAGSTGMASLYKTHPDLFEIVVGLSISP